MSLISGTNSRERSSSTRLVIMDFLTTATSTDVRDGGADVAVLPVGSFEQHGGHLPLITDTAIACIIAEAVGQAYSLFVLPPVTISCSHEHADFAGTVSISASTLTAIIEDIRASLESQGIEKLIIISGHGGNYVLSNLTQQANIDGPRVVMYPTGTDWDAARRAAGLSSSGHEDMHGGESETSILLHYHPGYVGADWEAADHSADDRPDLLLLGVSRYSKTGIIGRPSLATAAKGEALVRALVAELEPHLRSSAASAEPGNPSERSPHHPRLGSKMPRAPSRSKGRDELTATAPKPSHRARDRITRPSISTDVQFNRSRGEVHPDEPTRRHSSAPTRRHHSSAPPC